jgi:hypothetical protein
MKQGGGCGGGRAFDFHFASCYCHRMSACRRLTWPGLAAASLFLLLALPGMLPAEAVSALPSNKGFVTIREILDHSCSTCHDWTSSYDSIVAGGRVVPGSPEKSLLYQKIASDEMPMEGDKLTTDQKAFIKGWIAAGAPSTELPIAVPSAESPATAAGGQAAQGGSAAETGSSPASPASSSFLFFPSKASFHAVTGFTSSALFLAAGVIGIIHFVDMMDAAHAYRDSIGWTEGSDPTLRSNEIKSVWGGQQTLRWVHVGLLAGGEILYIGDAITGISMMTHSQPGKLTKHDIHRYAFFTHAALMVAQIGLGFAETWALSTGQHDAMIGLGAAHAAIGLAIPVVMIGAGLENLLLPE